MSANIPKIEGFVDRNRIIKKLFIVGILWNMYLIFDTMKTITVL